MVTIKHDQRLRALKIVIWILSGHYE